MSSPALSNSSSVRAQINWTRADAEELYRLPTWAQGYFQVDAQGRIAVSTGEDSNAVAITEVLAELKRRAVDMPVLLRFQDILRSQVDQLNEAFATARSEAGYAGSYHCVYPIKVNQLHEVVDEVMSAGAPWGMGLECGSKSELVAALAHLVNDEMPLVCNGIKDRDMLRLLLKMQGLGRNALPVIEKFAEYRQLQSVAAETGIKPRFGVRIRLGTCGSGRWAESGGHTSKFGISIPELVTLLEDLEKLDQLDSMQLLHFHLGSQIDDIQFIRQGVKEIARIYTQLHERGASVRYLDVGGGLGVNYGAGYDESDTGINYDLREYANAIVYSIQEICQAHDAPVPDILSESGRALTAHHSVLVVPVINADQKNFISPDFMPGEQHESIVSELFDIYRHAQQLLFSASTHIDPAQLLESLHDVMEKRQEADQLFSLGYLPLDQKGITERLYWSTCQALHEATQALDEDGELPPELASLHEHLAEQLLCDFSVFQSIIDHWSIGQGFPVLPLEGLDKAPTRSVKLVDLTCDSDGKVSHYVTSAPDKRVLPLPQSDDGVPMYLGFFMMGAYQDIMGDAHNLFGRVSEAHVYLVEDEADGFYIEQQLPGTSIREMLASVQYFPNDLHRRMSDQLREKVRSAVIRPRESVELLEDYMRFFSTNTYIAPDGDE